MNHLKCHEATGGSTRQATECTKYQICNPWNFTKCSVVVVRNALNTKGVILGISLRAIWWLIGMH